jgi:cystathionine beta-lyase/cystathionine gamma-synthase
VGRAELRSAGIAPELIRISVGAEPYVEIEAAIAAGLEASLQG